MALALCTISGRVYKGDGTAAKNTKIKAVKVVLAGELIATAAVSVFTDANGDFEIDLPREATAWIYADVQGLNTNGIVGVALAIPDVASAELATLVPASNVPGTVPVAIPGTSFAATFGDGINTEYTITHNLDSEDLFASFRLAAGTKESVAGVIWKPDPSDPANKIIVTTTVVPTLNQLRVVIKK